MATRHKSKSERDREWADAERHAWENFRARLAAAQTLADALALWGDAPRESSPGRKFYSNLGFFLSGFRFPGGATHEEKQLYVQLVERLDATGALKPELGKDLIVGLREALRREGPW